MALAVNIIAMPTDVQVVGDQKRYTADIIPVENILRMTRAIPLLIPALGSRLDIDGLLARIDGLFVPGGLTNVHPSEYGQEATEEDGPFDRERDATTLPLIRAALRQGVPTLMTCRGFQELNVALGGTLRRERDDLPEEEKHGTPASARTEDERYRIRQPLHVRPGGALSRLVGADEIEVNSLHSFLVETVAPGLDVEATAHDGTVEAVTVHGAHGFALGVVFHPEYWAERDAASSAILQAFAAAVRAYAQGKRQRQAAAA